MLLGDFASAQRADGEGIALSRQLPPRRPVEFGVAPVTEKPAQSPAETGDAATRSPSADQSGPAVEATGDTCLARLKAIPGNSVEAADPKLAQGEAACRVSEPVVVKAFALRASGKTGVVAFQPPVTLSCAMAQTVADWLGSTVQPLARGYFESDLTGLRVGGGHECRRRNRASAGPVSEHATGKALDIFAFQLSDGNKAVQVAVEKPSGLDQNSFLAAIRQSACGAFMTALGPGSDAAHANHLHVDIQERRSRSSRFCQ